jgi:hypothetical protein
MCFYNKIKQDINDTKLQPKILSNISIINKYLSNNIYNIDDNNIFIYIITKFINNNDSFPLLNYNTSYSYLEKMMRQVNDENVILFVDKSILSYNNSIPCSKLLRKKLLLEYNLMKVITFEINYFFNNIAILYFNKDTTSYCFFNNTSTVEFSNIIYKQENKTYSMKKQTTLDIKTLLINDSILLW